nr:chromosome segregation protein SMC [Sulfobacillus harzensis]
MKRIQIYGFKSFAKDVALELKPGITALVGPNGGGKSNVVDAVRWALGEQRLRDLRAERWEDLLHQGGPGRPAARMAEVSLEFDNHDGEMPLWPESLTVTRRYYRSGDSEYLINGQSARLKDIADLFLDSGLGRFSYAIISQGRVEGALLQKPLERLEQLQEAAGVSRYKVKKKETLAHLAETEAKLVRLGDLLDEVGRQMDEVRERAEAESRYQSWEALRLDWQRRLDYTEYHRAMEKKAKLQEQVQRVEEERQALAQELASVVDKGAAVRAEILELQSQGDGDLEALKRLGEQQTALRITERELASRLSHLKEEEIRLNESLERLERQRAELEAERPEVGPIAPEAIALGERHQALVQETKHREEERQSLRRELDGLDANLARDREARQRLEQRLARLRGMLHMGENQGTVLEVLAARQHEAQNLEREVQQLTQEVVRLTEERARLKAFQTETEQAVYSLRHQLAGRQARLRALHQLEAEGEGLGAGVRAVLRGQHQNQITGVIGTLGSLLEVEAELGLAIETALGGSHQDIVMENEQRARDAVRYLKTGSLGRATFLPLDTVRAGRVPVDDYRRLSKEPGVVGWAADLVSYPPTLRPAVHHVLGRVLVVQSLDDASRLGPLHHFRYKMVTLDGQVVHAGGAITGGSRLAQRNSATSRKVELDELTRRVQEERKLVAAKEELLASTRQEMEELDQKMDANRELLAERRNQFLNLRQELALDTEVGDPSELMAEAARLEQKIGEAEAKRRGLASQLESLVARLGTLQTELREVESALREREQGLRERELIAERIDQEILRVNEEEARSRERQEANGTERASLTEKRQAAEASLKELGEEIQRREAARSEQVERFNRLSQQALDLENRQRVLELDDRRMEQKINSWRQEMIEIAVRFESYVAPEGVEALSRSEEDNARRELARIALSLSELGPVVPGSLALFEQLSERKGFLEKESHDVEDARRELNATLKEIDQEMERRVNETAKRVEVAFNEACRQLYGGGDGGFTWLEGENAGVELWVRPPGKRPSHLSLLSGGEKALGGIAWLFSLLSVRRSPFVVLDEVEASLDEANASRFAQYVKTLHGKTQYVIVTHHRQTMEVADALWGVAGDGQGQSRLISVLLEDQEAVNAP